MAVEGAPVKGVDVDVILCSFGRANCEDLYVLPTE